MFFLHLFAGGESESLSESDEMTIHSRTFLPWKSSICLKGFMSSSKLQLTLLDSLKGCSVCVPGKASQSGCLILNNSKSNPSLALPSLISHAS